jgi:hypothetical protein
MNFDVTATFFYLLPQASSLDQTFQPFTKNILQLASPTKANVSSRLQYSMGLGQK